MSITFIGNEIPETERVITHFNSLDKALSGNGKLGFPIKTLVEIYGAAGIGKTTTMLTLGAIMAQNLGGRIDFADFEGQSYDTVVNALGMGGYLGEVNMLRTATTKTHSNILDNMIADFKTDASNVAMLDSVGAFMPPGELEGSVDDANMGQKPRIIGNWTRKIIDILNKENNRKVCFYITHQHSNIGFVGTHTSGGETKTFLNGIKIGLKKKDNYETGWLLEGTVAKNRHGKQGENFLLFVIGGQGVHRGLTSVFECVVGGMAEIERNVVKMDGQSYGKVAKMIENHADDALFAPFINALMSQETSDEYEEVENDEPQPKKRGRKAKTRDGRGRI